MPVPARPDALLDRHPLAGLAWDAAARAARFLAEERPVDLVIERKSTATDAVTAMDRGAEERIVDAVLSVRPQDAVLGEEGGERAGTSGVRWIVDPLDGTVNYLYRLPMWGVSIGVEVDGSVEVGVVIAPQLAEAYVGIRGHGAWSVGESGAAPIAASAETDMAMALVSTGYAYDPRRRREQAAVAAALIGEIRDLRRLGAATVDLCWTACGRLEGYYESGLNPWDIAAGALIAREAGCVVRSVDGDGDYAGTLLAAAPGIAVPLATLLTSSLAAASGEPAQLG